LVFMVLPANYEMTELIVFVRRFIHGFMRPADCSTLSGQL